MARLWLYTRAVAGKRKDDPHRNPDNFYEIFGLADIATGRQYVVQRFAYVPDQGHIRGGGCVSIEEGGADKLNDLIKQVSSTYDMKEGNVVGLFDVFQPGEPFAERYLRAHFQDTTPATMTPLKVDDIFGQPEPLPPPLVADHANWGEW